MTTLTKDSTPSEVRAEWYRRLREDDIPQAKKTLCRKRPDGTVGFCCLGVLTEMAVEAGVLKPGTFHDRDGGLRGQTKEYPYEAPAFEGGPLRTFTEEGSLAPPVQNWAGLPDHNPDVQVADGSVYSVAHVNDQGSRFPRIADLLEARYPAEVTV